MSDSTLSRYWNTLGLPPNSSLEQLETHYCVLIESIPENPTEEEEQAWHEIRRAYSVLRRACATRETKGIERISTLLAARAGLALGAGLLLGALCLLAFNYKNIAVRWTQVDPGTELRVKGSDQPYATVIQFERNHAFPAGNPGPAYKVRIAATGEEIWLGERVVELGMSR
jgi:hypothetical protein